MKNPYIDSHFDPDKGEQWPWTGVIGGLAGLVLFLYLALQWGMPDWWGTRYPRTQLLWLILLLAFVLMGIIDQGWLKGYRLLAGPRPLYHARWRPLLLSAFWRYVGIGLALSAARLIYAYHPIYQSNFYSPFRDLFVQIYRLYGILGFPYMVATLRWRGRQKAEFTDAGLSILLWLRQALRSLSERHHRPAYVFHNRRSKTVFLGFLVELFYLPLMSVFLNNQFIDFSSSLNQLVRFSPAGFQRHQMWYQVTYHGLYLMDVLLATGGYALPLRWLNNKIRSVEPTVLGWAVALVCYPPFDVVGQTYLPWARRPEWQIIQATWAMELLMILTLLLTAIYVIATMMFGTRFSNLTHRGILTRGPYGWVRHPAYIAKNISWWTENLPWMGNPLNILFLGGWNVIYFWRAVTEERHLSKDPAYVAYCQKVRYRFIPGIW